MILLAVLGFLMAGIANPECPEYRVAAAGADASFFAPIFDACPGFVPDEGAVAYQYARALDREERPGDAIEVLERGLRSMATIDPATADYLVFLIHREQDYDRYDQASRHFLALLEALPSIDFPPQLRQRVLDELEPVLPQTIRDQLGVDVEYSELPTAELSDDTGEILRAFWRGADPFPASSRNERLTEHLSRVAAVRGVYVRKDGSLDARGRTLVRYGAPPRDRDIREDPAREFGARRFHSAPGYILTGMDHEAPNSEIWVYPNIHGSLHFLFIEDRNAGGYRIGDARELVPFRWAGSARRSTEFLRIAEDLYRQLALQHADYGLLYDEVARYLTGGGGISNRLPAPAFAHSVVSQMQTLDRDIESRRELVAPTVHTNLREDLEVLPVYVRYARFRDSSGGTRLEVYWSTTVENLRPDGRTRRMMRQWGIDSSPSDLRFFVAATTVIQDREHRMVDRNVQRFRLGPFGNDAGLLHPQIHGMPVSADSFHASVQWDLLVYDKDDELGPVVKYATERFENLAPLKRMGEGLDVSDLKPLLVVEGSMSSAEGALVYPYDVLTPDAPLALEFEVYNLRQGDDGVFRYAAEYRIERLQRGARPGQRDEDRQAAPSVRVTFEASAETDRATILLDPADFDFRGRAEIVLEITDESTGARVERRIGFDVSRASGDGTTSLAFG